MMRIVVVSIFLTLLGQTARADSWNCRVNKHLSMSERTFYDRLGDYKKESDFEFELTLEAKKILLPEDFYFEVGNYIYHRFNKHDDGDVNIIASKEALYRNSVASFTFWQGSYQPFAYFNYSRLASLNSEFIRATCYRSK